MANIESIFDLKSRLDVLYLKRDECWRVHRSLNSDIQQLEKELALKSVGGTS